MASYKLVVMSDSHGDRAVVEAIKARYEGQVAAIFHNGDSEIPAKESVWTGIKVVRGNCDWDGDYPDDLVTRFEGLTIIQTHGHLYGINFDWSRLDLLAQSEDADICLYGHLHRPAAWRNGKTIFVNPGSVSQPRGDIKECLYAVLTVTDDKIKVDYYTREHDLYPSLSKEFDR
ncbi:metallophosphoesterase [Streptococcus fryi]